MARLPTARQRLEDLARRFEPALRSSFMAAVDDLGDGVQIGLVVEFLERGDVTGALRSLNIDVSAFRLFEEGIRQAYIGGGIAAGTTLPTIRDPAGAQVVFRFDARSPSAEAFIQGAGERITRISDDVLQAARQHMTQGLIDGRNPRSVALDLAGRLNRATGRREGGILGLTSTQEGYVATARRGLLSGDPDALRHYLTLGRRNRAYDGQILAAIRDGKALSADQVQTIVGKLSDSYLQLRAETIARTETIGTLNASQKGVYDQLVSDGHVRANSVRKTWVATFGPRTRDSHAALSGESAGKDEPFSNGLQYPGDQSGPPEEVINCRCVMDWRIDHFANVT